MPNASVPLRRFRFDQLATHVNDRVDDPAASGVDRYVGLEHLDADSLSIRRWGEITDVESTKLRFQPGDIIFGKRRVYQRKLAVADFEGICSAHAMVLRAKPDAIDPRFLPYFMQSDLFMERALSISVGSLSPTINWKDLAQQEFALPPIEEQRRIAMLLDSAARLAFAAGTASTAGFSLLDSLVGDVIGKCERLQPLIEYCDSNPESLTRDQLASDDEWDYADLAAASFPLTLGKLEVVVLSCAPSRAQRIARAGDFLVSTVRPNLRGHAWLNRRDRPIVASTGYVVLRPKPNVDSRLLAGALLSASFSSHCMQRATGTSYPAVRPSDIMSFHLPTQKWLENRGFAKTIAQAVDCTLDCVARETAIRAIYKKARNMGLANAIQ